MTDSLTPEQRSTRMSLIRDRNTRPELTIRRLLHKLGYRFKIHATKLPGRPDICFPGRNKVIFIHGCFWHRHVNCKIGHLPKTHTSFWQDKFAKTKERDARNERNLSVMGWEFEIVWECELHMLENLASKLIYFLGASRLTTDKQSVRAQSPTMVSGKR